MKKFLDLEDLSSYQKSFKLSNDVWLIVLKWNQFAKNTVGGQFVRAIDSISANIAEGFGRYGKKDKICFYRYAYGSIKESQSWLEKSKIRVLVSEQEYEAMKIALDNLPREIHNLIKYTTEKLQK